MFKCVFRSIRLFAAICIGSPLTALWSRCKWSARWMQSRARSSYAEPQPFTRTRNFMFASTKVLKITMQNNTFPQLFSRNFTFFLPDVAPVRRDYVNPTEKIVQTMGFLRSFLLKATRGRALVNSLLRTPFSHYGPCRFPVFPFRQPVCRSENFTIFILP